MASFRWRTDYILRVRIPSNYPNLMESSGPEPRKRLVDERYSTRENTK